jgi:TIR domain/Pentapeptide repeats (8 copies)
MSANEKIRAMANSEHLAKLYEGVGAWNDWRRASAGIVPDLAEADLIWAQLGAADLREADLTRANLSEANLSASDLDWAKVIGADLSGADLTAASIGYTTFGDNDLSSVKGLETVRHHGPSTIGIDTIYISRGNIPLAFLRGAGVPDNFIEYMGSLTQKPLEYYSCFISYSTKDQDFADRFYADLQNKGVRCWFAPHDVQGGRKLHEQIDEAIRLHDKLLLILSPHSMESEWVKTEIAKARKREVRDRRRVLFPIRLAPFETLRDWELFDADTGKDSAREIREYFIPDFSNWKDHDSYQEAFQRLISDLKASDSKPKGSV